MAERFLLLALDGACRAVLLDILWVHHDRLLVNLHWWRWSTEEEMILHWGGLLLLLLAIGAWWLILCCLWARWLFKKLVAAQVQILLPTLAYLVAAVAERGACGCVGATYPLLLIVWGDRGSCRGPRSDQLHLLPERKKQINYPLFIANVLFKFDEQIFHHKIVSQKGAYLWLVAWRSRPGDQVKIIAWLLLLLAASWVWGRAILTL